MGRAERVTAEIKFHDPLLYCERSKEGKLCVYRKSTRYEIYHLDDDSVLYFARPTPYFVFALTKDWRSHSEECDWGIEPILARLKAIDLWNRDLAGEAIAAEEKHLESTARDLSNNVESFLKDFRRQFAKSFDGVNTANMSKKDRRRDMDASLKWK